MYSTMHIYPWQMNPPSPPPIKHRSLENHYTKYISYIAQCIYTHGRLTPPLLQLIIDLWKTIIPNKFDIYIYIAQWTYMTPQSIKHRCLEYCYTKLGRSTPHSIEHRCHAYCYTKVGRYSGRSTSRYTPQSIKQQCLEYCYTKLGRSTGTDLWKTITPNKFHI